MDPNINPIDLNPMTRTDLTLVPNNGSAKAGLVTQYSDATFRRGEDILMSNVLSFDVKVWDPVNSLFVDVGENLLSPPGPFSKTVGAAELLPVNSGNFYGRLNETYGPNGHCRFDTWHPSAGVGTFAGNDLQPPYI
ncbi:MAG: hypothetical protein HQ581_15180, partial [Planctomycetes bacterium]|nr:hypothetical protein [Planctomycetota bacterium]